MKQLSALSLALLSSLGLGAQTHEPDLSYGLVGHYLLDGNWQDSSGNQNDCLTFGTYTDDREGNSLSALRLSEDGHYIHFPNIITLAEPEWTYALWLMPERSASEVPDMFLLSLTNVSVWEDVPLFIDDEDDQFKTYYREGFGKQSTGIVAEVDTWYHVAISSAADDTVRIYVNGEKRVNHAINFTTTAPNSFMLGSVIHFPEAELKGRFFGVVDDIRIYNRALADEEVATLHDPLWNFVPEPEPEPVPEQVPEPEYVHLWPTLVSAGMPLRLSTNTAIRHITIYDVQGRVVHQTGPTTDEEITLPLPPLASGMYVVHVHTATTRYRGKVVVAR